MKPETHKQITDHLTAALPKLDEALTLLCQATAVAVLDRQFVYGQNLLRRASNCQLLVSEVHGCFLPEPKKAGV